MSEMSGQPTSDGDGPAGEKPVVIPIEAYVSQDYVRRENELLWPKVWQIACREEEIPNVGDFYTYDILDESIIVVRTATRLGRLSSATASASAAATAAGSSPSSTRSVCHP